jgi:repressor LexA
MLTLTPRQKDVLAFLKTYSRKNQMPPTRKEICANFGWRSIQAAQDHLIQLERRGAVRLLPGGVSRGIIIL